MTKFDYFDINSPEYHTHISHGGRAMHVLIWFGAGILVGAVIHYPLGRWSQSRQEREYLLNHAPFWAVFERIIMSGRANRPLISVLCELAQSPEECARANEALANFPKYADEFGPPLIGKWDAVALEELEGLSGAGLKVAETHLVTHSYREGSEAHKLATEMVKRFRRKQAV